MESILSQGQDQQGWGGAGQRVFVWSRMDNQRG